MRRRWGRRDVDAPIDLWPVDDVVEDLVATADPWASAMIRTDAAIVRAARCVDLEAAAGRLSLDDVVTLYDAIAAVAGSGDSWRPALDWKAIS